VGEIEDGSTELCRYDFRYRKDARSQKRLDEVASMNLEREDERLGIIDDLKVRAEQMVSVTALTEAGNERGSRKSDETHVAPGSSLPLAAARFFAVRKRQ
jgi:hypothetical protein